MLSSQASAVLIKTALIAMGSQLPASLSSSVAAPTLGAAELVPPMVVQPLPVLQVRV